MRSEETRKKIGAALSASREAVRAVAKENAGRYGQDEELQDLVGELFRVIIEERQDAVGFVART